MYRHGAIQIRLKELIDKRGISKNKLSQYAEMQRTQINRYCNNTITRLDVDVLARICNALHCDISELLKYIPPQNAELIQDDNVVPLKIKMK